MVVDAQTIITLQTIIDNPGINLKGLAKKIPEKYFGSAVRFLFLDDENYYPDYLSSIIKDIYCVENRKGQFYYNSELKLFNEGDTHQLMIKHYLNGLKLESPGG